MSSLQIPQRRSTVCLGLVVLFALSLAVTTSGLGTIVLLDADEPRFAAASRTMAAGGDWIVPHFNGEERFDKPILIYWLQALSMRLVAPVELAARLPSAVSVALAAPFVARIGLACGLGLGWALLAGLMLATCAQSLIMAHGATADALLLLCTTIVAHGQVRRFVHGPALGSFLQVWLGLAAAFLTKGPPALVAPAALGVGTWWAGRPPRPASLAGGTLLATAVVAAWAIPALVRTEGRFWTVGILHHVVDRSLRPFEGHGGFEPWWYLFYIVTIPLTFLPWSVFLPAAWHTIRGRAGAPRGTPRLLLAWLGGTVLVFALVTSKLPHYPLPAFPSLCLATCFGLAAFDPAASRWTRPSGVILLLLGSMLVVGPPVAFWTLGIPSAVLPSLIAGGCLAMGFITAGRHLLHRQVQTAVLTTAATAVLGFSLLTTIVLPKFGGATLGQAAAHRFPASLAGHDGVHVFGLVMPSLTFYLRRTVRRVHARNEGQTDADRALELIAKPGHVVLVRARRLPELEAACARLARTRPELARRVRAALAGPISVATGFHPAKGRHETLLAVDLDGE